MKAVGSVSYVSFAELTSMIDGCTASVYGAIEIRLRPGERCGKGSQGGFMTIDRALWPTPPRAVRLPVGGAAPVDGWHSLHLVCAGFAQQRPAARQPT